MTITIPWYCHGSFSVRIAAVISQSVHAMKIFRSWYDCQVPLKCCQNSTGSAIVNRSHSFFLPISFNRASAVYCILELQGSITCFHQTSEMLFHLLMERCLPKEYSQKSFWKTSDATLSGGGKKLPAWHWTTNINMSEFISVFGGKLRMPGKQKI